MARLVHVESVRLVGSVPLDVRHGSLTQGERTGPWAGTCTRTAGGSCSPAWTRTAGQARSQHRDSGTQRESRKENPAEEWKRDEKRGASRSPKRRSFGK